jgi:hypothetical protein
MWHSHNEKEITTDDIFPGGMMTMLIIEPKSVDLDAGTGPSTGGGTPPPAMPNLTVLDNFNRANANTLGTNWQQLVTLGNGGIRVNGNQAFCANSGAAGLLCLPGVGANAYLNGSLVNSQGAAFTFANATLNDVGLYLKASGTYLVGVYASGIRVRYSTASGGQVVVETTSNGWITAATAGTLAAPFTIGDRLTAMTDATGTVSVWKTSGAVTTMIGTVPTTFTGTGQIGLHLPPGARVDDFAGGTP